MNPLALILVGLGVILIVIGFKGSQHNVLAAFKGVPSAAKGKSTPASKTAVNAASPPSVQAV